MTRKYNLTEEKNPIRVISWGYGIQSTTLAVMSVLGMIDKVDYIIAADTGWEKNQTYKAKEWYTNWLEERGQKVYTVSAGSIKDDIMLPHANIPFYTKPSGAPLQRQCTPHYKIEPIRRFLREILGTGKTGGRIKKNSVYCLLGISLDEFKRMKDSTVTYIKNVYPLVDMGITRDGCVTILKENNLPVPPKSACIICPYTNNKRWLDLKLNSPEEFNDAVEFDKVIREPSQYMKDKGIVSSLYLHKSLQPLDEVDFESMVSNLDDVCDSGYCFV